MAEKITAHIRRSSPMPVAGHWRIDCDCGWRGEISEISGPRAVPIGEAMAELNRLFVEHLPAGRRQLYVLVDQRPGPVAPGAAEDGSEDEVLGRGNFIMPEGKPCTLLRWWEDGGAYHGRVQGFTFGDPVLELPIGEIRTAEGRVFRMA